MKIQDVKNGLSLSLEQYFKDHGFLLRKANFEYIKKTNKNNSIFRIGIHPKTNWFIVTPSVFFGAPRINKIFNDALKRNIAVNGSTCGYGIDNKFNHKRGRYNVDDEDSLSQASMLLRKDFDEVALPWFDKVNSIESVDKFMNFRKDGKFRPMSVSSACIGLIAAKLAENKEFDYIYNDYYDFCVKAQSRELAEPIKIVKQYLDNHLILSRKDHKSPLFPISR